MKLLLRKDGKKVALEAREGERLLGCYAATFVTDSQFRKAAEATGVDRVRLLGAVDEFRRSEADSAEVDCTPENPPFVCRVRGLREPAEGSVVYRDPDPLVCFRRAVDSGPAGIPEPVIFWEDGRRLAALDIDDHSRPYAARATERFLYQIIEQVNPRPSLAWSTHGRGLRLMYRAAGRYAASEIASAAALAVCGPGGLLPSYTCEIKTITRHPLYQKPDGTACGPVREYRQNEDIAAIAAWLGRYTVTEGEIQEYLDTNGYVMGRRYSHNKCPASPSHDSKNEPVHVREDGIYCYSCFARDVCYGSRSPGWFPYSALAGARVSTQVGRCLDHMTHWTHAKYVIMEAVGMSEGIARDAYAAALRMKYPDDPRVDRVFSVCNNLVRFRGYWATPDGEGYKAEIPDLLAQLPACQFLGVNEKTGETQVKVSMGMVTEFKQTISLAKNGYPDLHPIWGIPIFGQHLRHRDESRVPIVLHTETLRPDHMAPSRPRYIPRESWPMTEEQAWEKLEVPFPGLHRNAVKLMIAAKGCAEGNVGLPPFVFIQGPTGASKTGTIQIAAAICGDSCTDPRWSANEDKTRAAVFEGKATGSFVAFNEIIKDGKAAGFDKIVTFLLNLTPDSSSHKMYVGPVKLGQLPVIAMTDIQMPIEMKQHAQLARRLVIVEMPQTKAWQPTMRDAGVNKFVELRASGMEYADAGNVILSSVIDEYFKGSVMTFMEIAERLGFARLDQCIEMTEKKEALIELFREVCAADAPDAADAKRWKGRGWKVIERGHQTPIVKAWLAVADPDFTTSNNAGETDWADLLGVVGPVTFELRSHGTAKVAIRFVRRRTREDYEVNQEIKEYASDYGDDTAIDSRDVGVGTAKSPAGVRGFRDPISREPDQDRK